MPAERPKLDPGLAGEFEELVRLAFQQRRKTLRNALRERLSEATVRAAGVDPGRRAETLSIAEFVALAAQLAQAQSEDRSA